MRQDGILLRFVEAVYLVNEHDSPLLAKLAQLARVLYHFTQVGDTCRDGAECNEVSMGQACNHLCQCRLAAARWSPQNHSGYVVLFYAAAQPAPCRQALLLAENLVPG